MTLPRQLAPEDRFLQEQADMARRLNQLARKAGRSTHGATWEAQDSALIASTVDPAQWVVSAATPTAGTLYLFRLWVAEPGPISTLWIPIASVASPTHFYASLWDFLTEDRLAVSADAAATVGSIGSKPIAFTTPYVLAEAGFVNAGFHFTGTVPNVHASGGSGAASVVNTGDASASVARFTTADTGLTNAPPSNHAARVLAGVPYGVALA